MGEKKTFEIERIIWNHHNSGKKISMDSKLMVDFVEPQFPKSPDEKAKEFMFLKENNIITDIDLMMSKNPDLTREQAIEQLEKNKIINGVGEEEALAPVQQPGQPAPARGNAPAQLPVRRNGPNR